MMLRLLVIGALVMGSQVRPVRPPPPRLARPAPKPAPAPPVEIIRGSKRTVEAIRGGGAAAVATMTDWEAATGVEVSEEVASEVLNPILRLRTVSSDSARQEFVESTLARYLLYRVHAAAGHPAVLEGTASTAGIVEAAWKDGDAEGERPFGELVTTSLPERAVVIVEAPGKKRQASTQSTFVLSPGTYTVTITPGGKKPCVVQVTIEAYKTHAADCR
jgi:hypothetical protein